MKVILTILHAWGASLLSCQADTDPCKALENVRSLPFKGKVVDDVAYNHIIKNGEKAIPCLVKHITDSGRMPDPRKTPKYENFAVGDLCVILLCTITGRPFEEQLPAEIRNDYKRDGVAVYFTFVERPENRKTLQEQWTMWLSTKSKPDM